MSRIVLSVAENRIGQKRREFCAVCEFDEIAPHGAAEPGLDLGLAQYILVRESLQFLHQVKGELHLFKPRAYSDEHHPGLRIHVVCMRGIVLLEAHGRFTLHLQRGHGIFGQFGHGVHHWSVPVKIRAVCHGRSIGGLSVF